MLSGFLLTFSNSIVIIPIEMDMRESKAIAYVFNEEKAAEAASYLLSLNGGSMPYMKLLKLLYIADRIYLSQYHASITTDSYYSLPRGPVATAIFDCIKHPEDFSAESAWNQSIATDQPSYSVILKKPFEASWTSEKERDILREVYEKYKNEDQFSISELTHSFPEWKDPNGSRIPLFIEDILESTISDEEERKNALDDISLSAWVASINKKNMRYLS